MYRWVILFKYYPNIYHEMYLKKKDIFSCTCEWIFSQLHDLELFFYADIFFDLERVKNMEKSM